jgi:hypothetical protein
VHVRFSGQRDPNLLGHPLDICERDPHGLVRNMLVDEGESAEAVNTSEKTPPEADK